MKNKTITPASTLGFCMILAGTCPPIQCYFKTFPNEEEFRKFQYFSYTRSSILAYVYNFEFPSRDESHMIIHLKNDELIFHKEIDKRNREKQNFSTHMLKDLKLSEHMDEKAVGFCQQIQAKIDFTHKLEKELGHKITIETQRKI